MTSTDQICTRVAEVFALIGSVPGEGPVAVTPLKAIVAELGLVAEEIDRLSRATATAYLKAEMGRHTIGDTHDGETLAGYLHAVGDGAWILINRDSGNPVVRRRFTVAHELGHYVLHIRPLLDTLPADEAQETIIAEAMIPPSGPDGDDIGAGQLTVWHPDGEPAAHWIDSARAEDEADRFAAELLMPEVVCRALTDRLAPEYGHGSPALVRRLAGELLVSQAAMTRRLRDLVSRQPSNEG